jgi:hypothetical protein
MLLPLPLDLAAISYQSCLIHTLCLLLEALRLLDSTLHHLNYVCACSVQCRRLLPEMRTSW